MNLDPYAMDAAIKRELGENWRAPLPSNPTAGQVCEAWQTDAETVHQAASRVEARRREELADWHRERLRELTERQAA